MKNILNVNKICLKPILMSFLILFGTPTAFNAKIACASGSSEKPSKDNNVNDSTSNREINKDVFSAARGLHFHDLLKDLSQPEENETFTIPDDMAKSIIDLANNKNNKK